MTPRTNDGQVSWLSGHHSAAPSRFRNGIMQHRSPVHSDEIVQDLHLFPYYPPTRIRAFGGTCHFAYSAITHFSTVFKNCKTVSIPTVTKNYIPILFGLLLLAGGFSLMKTADSLPQALTALPYVCVGVGSGFFDHGMGNLLSERAVRKDPELKKQLDIEKKDERNIAIADRAKGKAFDMMTFVFGALMVSFALMDVEMAPLLLLVFAYLLVHGCSIYYCVKFEKEM